MRVYFKEDVADMIEFHGNVIEEVCRPVYAGAQVEFEVIGDIGTELHYELEADFT